MLKRLFKALKYREKEKSIRDEHAFIVHQKKEFIKSEEVEKRIIEGNKTIIGSESIFFEDLYVTFGDRGLERYYIELYPANCNQS